MFLVYCIIAAVVLGYLTGGRLSNYLNAPLKMVLLPSFAFLIEASFGIVFSPASPFNASHLGYFVCAEYLILAVFVIANHKQRGMKLLGAATVLNCAAISANGFRMPVSPVIYNYPALSSFVERIQSGELIEYTLVNWDAPLWFLGDTVPLFSGLASAGDFLMALAMFIIIFSLMKTKKNTSDSSADAA
jgi:hypothetical protein